MIPDTIYYECHITLDPVKGLEREMADLTASIHAFKLAKLLMQKPGLGRLEESKLDTFMTGHSRNYDDIKDRMVSLIALLKTEGFVVRRYKIEACVLDSRTADTLGLL